MALYANVDPPTVMEDQDQELLQEQVEILQEKKTKRIGQEQKMACIGFFDMQGCNRNMKLPTSEGGPQCQLCSAGHFCAGVLFNEQCRRGF